MKKPQYLDVPCAQIRRIFSPLTIGALILYGVLGGGARVAQGQSLSLVWSDEFNGTSVDTTKWAFESGNNNGWGNNELEFYTSRTNNAYVTNGVLHIRAQIETTNGFHYTSARMKTQGKFSKTYGMIEFHAKLPQGTGFWPALWMLGTNISSVGWPACGEIDVMENKGTASVTVGGTIHYNSSGSPGSDIYQSKSYNLPTPGDSVTNFHTYAIQWSTNSIIWLVDGVSVQTWTSWTSSLGPFPAPFDRPFYLIVNLAVGGNFVGNPTTSQIDPYMPGEMVIDYIRVYDYINPVSIAVQANPSNGGTVTGGGTYNSGTNVTVCASANVSCYSFANWTLNGNVVSTSACYTFTAASNATLVANFTPLAYYTISTSSSPAGDGSTSGGGTMPCGSNVTVCASAIPCYGFTTWTLNGNVVSTSPCYTFAAASNETLVANFAPASSYTITTGSSPSAGGSTSGGGTVACVSNVTVCATPNGCYNFANWTDQYSNLVSTSVCYTFTPNGNAALVANFIPITNTITTSSSPAGSGSISGGGAVICGSNVTVCATPNPCYSFVNWTDQNSNVVSTSGCYNFTAAGNEAIVANFATISYGGSTGGSLSNLHSFSYNDGAYPIAGLVPGSDGNFYGTTYYGGSGGSGTVFRISPTGSLTNLHSFSGPDGTSPYAGLVQGSDGNFYGTTFEGGAIGYGAVFRITPGGSLTNLHSFSYGDGAYPFAGLVLGSDSNLYGTTEVGGANGGGTVFRITPGGSLATLHSFSYSDGVFPIGGLVLGSDSNFYGTTYGGGPGDSGTVFRISSSGSFRSLYSFSGPDGALPFANLIQGSDGNFYGTTSAGGTFSDGAVFRISPGGSLTDLWSFTGCSDGATPYAGLVQGSDGNFYGTTSGSGSGSSPYGTVFRLDPSGHFTNLWSFTGGVDGAYSYATLVQGNDRAFYGTAQAGGANGYGIVFRIDAGLCGYALTPNSTDFSPAGGSGSLTVTATGTNCAWTAMSNSGFITITSGSGGTGSGTVSYTVTADTNTNSFGRTGTITIADQTFTVTQASLGCSFTLDSTNASFNAAGGSGHLTVSVNGSNCAWTATSNSGFISITSGSSSGGNGTLNYAVAANTNSFPLIGTMTIAGQTFTVTQGGFGCSAVLAVSSSPAGGGTTSGGSTVGCGSNVTVCATPNACYSFVNWTMNGNAVSTSPCFTFAAASNETLVANFAPIFSYTVSTRSSPLAGGSTSGGGTVACGSNVTVCTSPSPCYNFVNWTDQNSNAVSTSACYTFVPNSNSNLVANFIPITYTITTTSSPADGGSTSGGRTVCGSVTVCASPSPCYNFVNWTYRNNNVVSTSACYSFTAASNETLVANFAPFSYGGLTSGSLTNLHSFTGGSDGANSGAGLVQGSDGNFYGTTGSGSGASAYGTLFRIGTNGALMTLWSFTNGVDGASPGAGLVQGSDGSFYGTTYGSGSGASAYGTVFRISPSGSLTTLWSFTNGLDGANSYATLIQGSDGNFYGTTTGSGSGPSGNGTVFRITASGSLSNLHSFGGSDGANPYAMLVQGTDGNFYGTTYSGGTNDCQCGTVFRISPGGSLTTLWSFTNGLDGANSYGRLAQGGDGNFYGTTSGGGPTGYGTVFRISPTGNLTNLWAFSGCFDGASPYAGLVQGSDGNFYGTTSGGGPSGYGTAFRISPDGGLTALHSFGGSDGANPYAALVQGSDGSFYGTTYAGGNGYGTVFQLLVPLNPPANQISAIQLAGGNVIVTIPSVAGETYQLQYCDSLTLSNWSNVGGASMTNSIGGWLSLTNFGGASSPQGFYRFDITP